MILVTTTPSVDGYTITNYQGIVFGEVVSGVNMFKDLGAGLRNMFGGRSQGYEVFCFNVCSTGSAVFFRSVG
ncbi:putative heavy-metal-binding [Bifidobacterium longum]|nr:putative heavy-metal-binding [Bifidobacterium longum]